MSNVMRVAHVYLWNLMCGLIGRRKVRLENSSMTKLLHHSDKVGQDTPSPHSRHADGKKTIHQ